MEKYNQETLDDILLDAKHGLSFNEIAARLNIPPDEFIDDYFNQEYKIKAYYESGRTQGLIEVDSSIYNLAANGSHSAQEAYKKRLVAARIENKMQELKQF